MAEHTTVELQEHNDQRKDSVWNDDLWCCGALPVAQTVEAPVVALGELELRKSVPSSWDGSDWS